MLDHTLREAARLDLGVDMATGTGWPFGGPWVGDDTSPRTIAHKTWASAAASGSPSPSGCGRRRSFARSAIRFTSSTKARRAIPRGPAPANR